MATAMNLSRERGATDMQIGVDEPVDTAASTSGRLPQPRPRGSDARMFFYEREL